MKMKTKLYSTCLLSILAVSCSKDDDGNSKKKPNSESTLSVFDAKSFKNTKSKNEAIKKAGKTKEILNGVKSKPETINFGLRSNLMSVNSATPTPPPAPEPNLDEYELFGREYDYANFPTCEEVMDEYLSDEMINPIGRECMREFDKSKNLYQAAIVDTDTLGEISFPWLHFLVFERIEDGTFIPAPIHDGSSYEVPEPVHDESVDTGMTSEPNDTLETSSTFEESSSYDFDPFLLFGDFTEHMSDCDQAYKQFEETYKGVESNLNEIVGMVKQPSSLNLVTNEHNRHNTSNLQETDLDEQSASKLSFEAMDEFDGLKTTGFVSLGADDTRVLARMKLESSIDYQKFFESMLTMDEEMFGIIPEENYELPNLHEEESIDMSYGADFENKVLEMRIISAYNVTGSERSSFNLSGAVVVSDKSGDKFISKDMTLSGTSSGESHTIKYITKATLKNDRSIENIGTITLDGETIKYDYTIKRNESGNCQVTTEFGDSLYKVIELFSEETEEEVYESSFED